MRKLTICFLIGLCIICLVACISELPDQTETTTAQTTQAPTKQTTEQIPTQQTTTQAESESSQTEQETTFGPLHFPEETT